jgi:hypothetical protein
VRETLELFHGFALGAEREQERTDLRGRRLAGHDGVHRGRGFVALERPAVRELGEDVRPKIRILHEQARLAAGLVRAFGVRRYTERPARVWFNGRTQASQA